MLACNVVGVGRTLFDFEALGWYGGPDPSSETRSSAAVDQPEKSLLLKRSSKRQTPRVCLEQPQRPLDRSLYTVSVLPF